MTNKTKKKRNKVYRGADAAITRPIVTKVQANDRNKISQWWFDNKRIAKPVIITSGVVILIIWLVMQIIYFAS